MVARIEGIKNFQEYVLESSCTHRLQDVRIPLFFLSAYDDPIFPSKCIPIDKCYENILIGVTKAGGHLCFFEGNLLPHKQWFPEPCFEFFDFVLGSQRESDSESRALKFVSPSPLEERKGTHQIGGMQRLKKSALL